MSVFVEGVNLGDLLKFEAPNLYSRDLAQVIADQDMPLGQVLAQNTQGIFVSLDFTATGKRGVVAGILLTPVAANPAAPQAVPMLTRHAIVADHALRWPAGITEEQRTKAISQLRAIGVLVRQGV